jgi:DNA-binding transcriptional ArsR family regulator
MTGAVVEALAESRRRTVLEVLRRLTPTDPEELATQVIAAEDGKRLTGVSRSEVRTARLELRHRHLPKLADADLIEYADDGTVTLTSHSPFEVWEFLCTFESGSPDWNSLLAALETEDYRTVVSAIADAGLPTDRDALATKLSGGAEEGTADPESVEEVALRLHHAKLPKLDAVGVLSYDAETGTIRDDAEIELVDRVVSRLVE